jgi:hypothetical protein
MTALGVAIERKQWEVVSLRLLLGVCGAAAKLPPATLTELIDLVGGQPPGRGEGARGG